MFSGLGWKPKKKKKAIKIVKATHDDKYRKSSNTPFYLRQNENVDKCNYFIDEKTMNIVNKQFEFEAVLCDSNDAENEEKQLKLIVSRVIDDIVRVSIKELNDDKNKKKRYQVNDNNDVLMNDARKALPFSTIKHTENGCILAWNSYCIKIFYQPFLIHIYESNELQILMNNRNKFYFEPYSNCAHSETALNHTYYRDYGASAIGLDFDFVELQSNDDAKEKEMNVYGIPSHSTPFSLPSTNSFDNAEAYRMYNLDVYKYKINSPAMLYGSIPYIINHNALTTHSILWCNSSETFVEIHENKINSKNVRFMSETCALETFILLHQNKSKRSYLSQYYGLTGPPQLPPLFAVGHHQCRWDYVDEKDVMDINDKFNEYKCPNDVIWLDIGHTEKKKYFTWDFNKFPDPKRLIKNLSNADTKRKLVCIVDPHIKKDENYSIYNIINKNNYWVQTRENKNFAGKCWPGQSLYPDFINAQMRELWGQQFPKYMQNNNIFVWNDMNEPSVFDGMEGTMPCCNKHCDAIHFDLRHEEVHNLYGYYFHKASFEGLLKRKNELNQRLRPFILSRSFFIGSHKFGAIWTGDNKSNWKHLQISIAMLLSLSVAGMPFVGADVGGFFGHCSAQLMQRWYNLAAFYPFFRNHCHHNAKRQEFWMYDTEMDSKYMQSMRNSIIQRYKLLPYIYTLFYLSFCAGHPIMRPLWYEFESDINTFDREDAFMFGDALFIVPIVTPDTSQCTVVLPQNHIYYQLTNDDEKCMVDIYGMDEEQSIVNLKGYSDTIPVLRLGGKLTVERHRFMRRSASLMKYDPITIIMALDRNNFCIGKYYLDDGETLNHLDCNEYMFTQFIFDSNIFTNKIIHSNEKIQKCNIYQIWILMSNANSIPTKSVILHSKHKKTLLDNFCYKTPNLLVFEVNIAVNYEFEIVFE